MPGLHEVVDNKGGNERDDLRVVTPRVDLRICLGKLEVGKNIPGCLDVSVIRDEYEFAARGFKPLRNKDENRHREGG